MVQGTLSGMSLRCSNPDHGGDCVKDCHGMASHKLVVDEICRRLIAWDTAGLVAVDRDAHKRMDGPLLRDFAELMPAASIQL